MHYLLRHNIVPTRISRIGFFSILVSLFAALPTQTYGSVPEWDMCFGNVHPEDHGYDYFVQRCNEDCALYGRICIHYKARGLEYFEYKYPNAPSCSNTAAMCDLPNKSSKCSNSSPSPRSNNPIVFSNGKKYLVENDIRTVRPNGVHFTRYYNYIPSPDNPAANYSQLWSFGPERDWVDTSINEEVYAGLEAKIASIEDTGGTLINYHVPYDYLLVYIDNSPYFVKLNLYNGAFEIPDPQGNFRIQKNNPTPEQGEATAVYTLNTRNGGSKVFSATDGKIRQSVSVNGQTQTYSYVLDQTGYHILITDSYGHQLSLSRLEPGHEVLTDLAGRETHYYFDDPTLPNPKLKVVYPDDTPGDLTDNPYREYEHISAFDVNGDPTVLNGALSKIYDNGELYISYDYDPVTGMPISEEKAGGVDHTELEYTTDANNKITETRITNALGRSTAYEFDTIANRQIVTKINGLATNLCAPDATRMHYDDNGYLLSTTDKNGNVTDYTHDADGFQTQRIEAVGTPEERVITTQWHPQFALPLQIEAPRKMTNFIYTTFGALKTRTEIDTVTGICASDNTQAECRRITTYTYNSNNQVLTIDGPRTDVNDITTYTYDADGNRDSITNALNQTTLITSYDAHGNPLSITDPNGTITTLSYDARQRLVSRTVADSTPDAATATFTYNAVGDLVKITQANGSFLKYSYDEARRLKHIEDNVNNRITYTLDKAGNRTAEEVFDEQAMLVKTQTRLFDELSRLVESLGAESQLTKFGYDLNDNLTSTTLPSGATTIQSFDALNRLIEIIDPENGSSHPTNYAYDAQDNLTSVTDPNGHTTSYSYNAFGDVISQTSPNTGITTFTYDSAGNRSSQTDARGITVNYTYDSLNRLITMDFPGTQEDVDYSYDDTQNANRGIGRVTQITDHSGSTTYRYDRRGNIIRADTTIDIDSQSHSFTMQYAYDAADNLTQITYPSGRTVDYTRNALGQLTAINSTSNHQSQTLVDQIQYQAFGPIQSLRYGNGLNHNRSFNLDQRVTAHSTGIAQSKNIVYDANGNITQLEDLLSATQTQTFQYDALNRLGGYEKNSSPACFAYDGVGNRVLASPSVAQESQTGGGASVLEGLLAAYHFEGANPYADTTGNGNNGSSVGQVDIVAGRYGQGVSVVNSSGYIDFGPITGWQGLDQYSMSAWIQLTGFSDWQLVLGKAIYWASGDTGLHCENNNCGAYIGRGHARSEIDYTHLTHVWHHWSVTYNQGTLSFYLDGQLVASSSYPNTPGGLPLRFGASIYGTYPAKAMADDIMIHNRVLTPVEIQSLARANGSPLTGSAGTSTLSCNGGEPGDIVYEYHSGSQRLETIQTDTTTNYLYDANGNTTAMGSNTFNYNNANRLSSATANGLTTSYRYNALGQRAWKNNRNETILFLYDQAGQLVAQYDGTGNRVNEYLYLNGQPIALIDSQDAVYYVINDHLGTPQKLMDQSQAVVWEADYLPFGEATVDEDPDGDGSNVTNNLRFAGQYFDQETGLHYNWFRYYDPGTGRYITSDPIGLAGGINTYGYAYQNPIINTDPQGLAIPAAIAACAASPPCAAAAAAATIAAIQAVKGTIDAINNSGGGEVIPFPPGGKDGVKDKDKPNCPPNPGDGNKRDCTFTGLAGVELTGQHGMTIQCQYRCPRTGLRTVTHKIGFRSENPAFLCPSTIPE